MKFFKFYKVDAATGISVVNEKPVEGPTNPSLPSMGTVHEFGGMGYASAGDDAEAAPDNNIFEITEEEYNAEFETQFRMLKTARIAQAYEQEKGLRAAQFGKYHDTASAAGIYKYDLAKAYVADNTVDAGAVAAEATARGLTTLEMANKIVTNHEAFRTTEAKLAGLRGKIVDRLEGLTFDATDAEGSWAELAGRTEVIGQLPEEEAPAGTPAADLNTDVTVGYYDPALSTRWEYLD